MTTSLTTAFNPGDPLAILQKFGLEERSARLYLALLELGEASILTLAKQSGVERTVIYYLIKDLRRFGLVDETYDAHHRLRLKAVSPKKLIEYENQRHIQIKNALPELEALYHDQPEKPRIRIFEGLEGIDQLYDDVIATLSALPKDRREMLTYSSIDRLAHLPIRNQEAFRQKRGGLGIRVRVIANDTPEARDFAARGEAELRQSRLLPSTYPELGATFVVYANKIAQYNLKGEIYVLAVENKELADTQRVIFDLAWEQAGSQSRSVRI